MRQENTPNRDDIQKLLHGFKAPESKPQITPKTALKDELLKAKAPKTSLQMQYSTEAELIKSKIGDIEQVRQTLGLSRRKMCQLLLVDPSAWTRWTKAGKAPLHIYRSLQWYLALINKDSAWHPQNSFNRIQPVALENEIVVLKAQLKQLLDESKSKTKYWQPIFLVTISMLIGIYLGASV